MRIAIQGSNGLALALISAGTFGTSGIFATALIDAGWTPGAAVVTRILLAALVLTAPALRAMRGQWRLLLGRAGSGVAGYGLVAVAGCQFCYFNAVKHLSVGVALLLEYLGILLVVGWLWVRHGQRPRRLTVAGAVVALVGLVLVLDLTGSQHLDGVGVVWGLGAGIGLAAYFVLSAGGAEPLPPLATAWAGMVVGGVALALAGSIGVLPMHAAFTDVRLAHRSVSWLVPVFGVALISTAIAYVTGIAAVRHLRSKLASFIGLTEVLFAVLFAWLLLGQIPGVMQVLGGACIIGGVALVKWDESRTPGVEAEPVDQQDAVLRPASA